MKLQEKYDIRDQYDKTCQIKHNIQKSEIKSFFQFLRGTSGIKV